MRVVLILVLATYDSCGFKTTITYREDIASIEECREQVDKYIELPFTEKAECEVIQEIK